MVSNQVLQSTIDGLKAISKVDFCALDRDGKVLAGTFEGAKHCEKELALFEDSGVDGQEIKGCRFFKIFDGQELEYVLLAGGDSKESYMVGKMAAFQIQSLLAAYKERYDKDNFIKNLLLDNLLPVDIYSRAQKLHIDTDVKRVIYIIETLNEKDGSALDAVKSLIGENQEDFITAVDSDNVVVIKELSEKDEARNLEKIAAQMSDALRQGGRFCPRIAYGTVVNDIKEVSRSYREAVLALDVGRIFFKGRDIIAYNSLGLGRLIYQLPIPLCRMFIKEIFGRRVSQDFDEEALATINKFFENSLNVSETSRQLYIHRNTLVYRLDKLKKTTGLDLRVFDDAITFKIAMMVVDYMKYMESPVR